MNKTIKYICLLLAAIVIISCEQDSSIIIPTTEDRLAVQAIISDDDVIKARISNSRRITSEKALADITDAQLDVYQGDEWIGQMDLAPVDSSRGIVRRMYQLNHDVQPGTTYTLRAKADGYKDVRGTTTTPPSKAGSITDIQYIGKINEYESQLQLTIADTDPGDNYYHLIMYRSDTLYLEGEHMDTLILSREPSYYRLSTARDDLLGGQHEDFVSAFDVSGLLIRDINFNSGTLQLNAQIQRDFLAPNSGGRQITDLEFELRTVNEDYYRYWHSARQNERTNNEPLVEPVIVYSNIENGFGSISAYTKDVSQLKIED